MANYELVGRRLLHQRARRRTRRHWLELLAILVAVLTWYVTLAPSALAGPVTYAVVSGHSMEPSLYTGDLVLVRKQADYQVGDTVLTNVMGGFVIHKIVWISGSSVRTQGVNNDFVDTWTLPRSAILGKQFFVFKQFGTYMIALRTNPLLFGLFAAGLGSLLLITPRRKKLSPRLQKILESAPRELPQATKSYLNTMLIGLYVLSGASLVITGLLLANHARFYPRLLISLVGLIVSILAFELLGNWVANGKDLDEPEKSLAIFRKHLYRIDPTVHISGPTMPVASAVDLMTFAEIAKTPILHMVLSEGQVHKFMVVTDELNYVFTVDLTIAAIAHGRHKK